MSSDQLVRRMLCSRAKVPAHKLTGGYIGDVNHGQLAQAALFPTGKADKALLGMHGEVRLGTVGVEGAKGRVVALAVWLGVLLA